jgi:hypothetical protein
MPRPPQPASSAPLQGGGIQAENEKENWSSPPAPRRYPHAYRSFQTHRAYLRRSVLERKCCQFHGPSRRDGWAGRLTAVPCEAAQYGARNGARHLIELDGCCGHSVSLRSSFPITRTNSPSGRSTCHTLCRPRFYRSLDTQKEVFERILRACARAGGKILTIHSVRAAAVVLDMLEAHLPAPRGKAVLHWFTGTMSRSRLLSSRASIKPRPPPSPPRRFRATGSPATERAS